MKQLYLGGILFYALFVAACGDEKTSSSDAGSNDDTESSSSEQDYPFVEASWKACPLFAEDPLGPKAQCAMISVPLDWDNVDGEVIELFVQRLIGAESNHDKQIWILHGGPDHSADYAPLQETLVEEMPEADVYMLDHRGTGRSTRIECSDISIDDMNLSDDEVKHCIQELKKDWGEGLSQFTTTAAAKDVGYLMNLMDRQKTASRFIYGLSYGTLWTQRFLQLYPDDLDGVVIEGIANPTFGYNTSNENAQRPFNDLLKHCAEDQFCSEKLGTDPGGVLDSLLEKVEDEGHCKEFFAPLQSEGFSASQTVKSLLWLLMELGWDGRVLVPAVIHRVKRCSASDITALFHLLELMLSENEHNERYSSSELFYHIHLTTFWTLDSKKCDSLKGADSSAYRISTSVPDTMCRLQKLGWPVAQDEELKEDFASTDTPMLMLNGAMDVQTATLGARKVAEHFTGKNQRFIEFPRTGHSPLHDSFVIQDDMPPCAFQIFLSFFTNPEGPLDMSCIEQIRDIDFTGKSPIIGDDMAALFFGTSDLYE